MPVVQSKYPDIAEIKKQETTALYDD